MLEFLKLPFLDQRSFLFLLTTYADDILYKIGIDADGTTLCSTLRSKADFFSQFEFAASLEYDLVERGKTCLVTFNSAKDRTLIH